MLNKKSFASVSKKLTGIIAEYDSVVTSAEAELAIIKSKQEELDRQRELQTAEVSECTRVATNLRIIFEGKLSSDES